MDAASRDGLAVKAAQCRRERLSRRAPTRLSGVLLATFLALGATALSGTEPAGRADVPPPPTPKAKLNVLHRHRTADGRVAGYWMGIDTPRKGEYGSLTAETEELWFEFRDPGASSGRWLRFRPKGDLFFGDWTFDIFSRDDAVVVLMQDHYGPFHVVWTRDLEGYLRGHAPPTEVVPPPLAKGEVARVHKFLGWRSQRAFEFRASCCATHQDCRHTIGSQRPAQCGPLEEFPEH